MKDETKTGLIDRILEIELEMFQSVPTLERAACQDAPDSFRLIRNAQFLTWSEGTLESYLQDLQDANKSGRNLMTEKYALMDDLIPHQNVDPTIDSIVNQQLTWQEAMFDKYPHLMGRARPMASSRDSAWATSFQTYLRGELETYSPRTLGRLWADICERKSKNENMTEELYLHMVKAYGYRSLDEAEDGAAEAALSAGS